MAVAPEQRVFLNSDGFAENVTFLSEILSSATSQLRSVYAAVLDVKNVFATVQHTPLMNILRSHGAPYQLVWYVHKIYALGTTSIQLPGLIRKGLPLPTGLQSNLDTLVRGLVTIRLEISPGKSHLLSLVAVGKTRKIKVLTEDTFKLGDKYLTPLGVTEWWKYLGISCTARGVKAIRKEINEPLRRISEAPPKPYQRTEILRNFLIPSLRRWLRLPRDVDVGFSHAPPSASGLIAISTSALSGGLPLFSRRVEWADNVEVVFGDFLDSTLKVKNVWKAKLLGSVDGRYLEPSNGSKLSTSWVVSDTSMIPTRDYISLRTSRGRRTYGVLPKCRVGCNKIASANHISQKSVRTHEARMARHNNIVQVVADQCLKRGWSINKEPCKRASPGLRKLDIKAVYKKKREGSHRGCPDSPGQQSSMVLCHKGEKYGMPNRLDAVKSDYNVKEMGVIPIILTWKGNWFPRPALEIQEVVGEGPFLKSLRSNGIPTWTVGRGGVKLGKDLVDTMRLLISSWRWSPTCIGIGPLRYTRKLAI
ncbi:hypothetical protein PR048_013275 [Dryococelus australis]|uniref:Reverse transcriptase domain-containing protein n=1 Tax=Dryococelus australis TaxID=614101 RepID=A0ABQ9HS08_9NEOP|nr:hypothetical protein PR048_013275 [Dryococelus australis]